MQIQFVPVKTPEDIQALAALADEVWHEYFTSILSLEQIDYMVKNFQSASAISEQIGDQGYRYFFLRSGEKNLGYTGIKAENGKLFLSKIYLLRCYRGQGYASQTFQFLEKICRQEGLTAIWLTVNRHNDATIAIYRQKGFQSLRTQVADIGNGFVMDDYIMEKTL